MKCCGLPQHFISAAQHGFAAGEKNVAGVSLAGGEKKFWAPFILEGEKNFKTLVFICFSSEYLAANYQRCHVCCSTQLIYTPQQLSRFVKRQKRLRGPPEWYPAFFKYTEPPRGPTVAAHLRISMSLGSEDMGSPIPIDEGGCQQQDGENPCCGCDAPVRHSAE